MADWTYEASRTFEAILPFLSFIRRLECRLSVCSSFLKSGWHLKTQLDRSPEPGTEIEIEMKSDRERCERVKKRMYLPDVDEYNSSSEPLTGKEEGK